MAFFFGTAGLVPFLLKKFMSNGRMIHWWVIQILQFYDTDFKITVINMFKKINDKMNRISQFQIILRT